MYPVTATNGNMWDTRTGTRRIDGGVHPFITRHPCQQQHWCTPLHAASAPSLGLALQPQVMSPTSSPQHGHVWPTSPLLNKPYVTTEPYTGHIQHHHCLHPHSPCPSTTFSSLGHSLPHNRRSPQCIRPHALPFHRGPGIHNHLRIPQLTTHPNRAGHTNPFPPTGTLPITPHRNSYAVQHLRMHQSRKRHDYPPHPHVGSGHQSLSLALPPPCRLNLVGHTGHNQWGGIHHITLWRTSPLLRYKLAHSPRTHLVCIPPPPQHTLPDASPACASHHHHRRHIAYPSTAQSRMTRKIRKSMKNTKVDAADTRRRNTSTTRSTDQVSTFSSSTYDRRKKKSTTRRQRRRSRSSTTSSSSSRGARRRHKRVENLQQRHVATAPTRTRKQKQTANITRPTQHEQSKQT